MRKSIYLLSVIAIFGFASDKIYLKNYFQNKIIASEGWSENNQKVDYWYFYYPNGNKKEEGHFENNKKTKWWIFYDSKKEVLKKCEFFNDKMNGLCIVYNEGAIIRAEKYNKGKKIKQWESLSEFKKEYSVSMLND